MQTKSLYRIRFRYPEEWSVNLAGVDGVESQHLFIAEGRCEGRIAGRFRGVNHPRRRTDHTYVPDFQGVIETDDGATILVDTHGYGRAYPLGRRQIVVSSTHLSEHDSYRWLNDVICVGTGEVRSGEQDVELVIDVAELIWEPIPE